MEITLFLIQTNGSIEEGGGQSGGGEELKGGKKAAENVG